MLAGLDIGSGTCSRGGRTGEKHVLPSSVASGRRDPAGHRADGRRDIRVHAQRVRPPADTHVPRARVRGAGEPQERAEGHEAHGPECRIRRPNPYRKYSSYRGETGARAENLLNRDFAADRPWVKLGTDVTEFRVADGKAYPAPVYDMGSKEIVAWDVSRHPDMAQQRRARHARGEAARRRQPDPTPTWADSTGTGGGATGSRD